MDWQEKWQALIALNGSTCDNYVSTDVSGAWYVHLYAVEIGDGHVLTSGTGRGSTPQAAIEATWVNLTTLKPNESIVINAMDEKKRRSVRWNGFMWADV